MATIPHRTAARHGVGRAALGVLLALHGVAHIAGLTDSWEKAAAGGELEYLGGIWAVSDPSTLRVAGVAWALVGAFMIVASALLFMHHHLARRVVITALGLSLALSSIGLWGAVIGVVVNLAMLAVVVFMPERVGLAESHEL